MSDEFNLDKSRWFNVMKCGLACKAAKTDAAIIIERAANLQNFEYEAVIGTELATAETELSEALLAVKLARKQYEKFAKHPKPHLVAAE